MPCITLNRAHQMTFLTVVLIIFLMIAILYLWMWIYDHFARIRQDAVNQALRRDIKTSEQIRLAQQDAIHKFLLENNDDDN